MSAFSFSPRYKKLFDRIVSGKVESKNIVTSVDAGAKKTYTVSFDIKDEFGDTVRTQTNHFVPKEILEMRKRLVDEYLAITEEYNSNISALDSIMSIFVE